MAEEQKTSMADWIASKASEIASKAELPSSPSSFPSPSSPSQVTFVNASSVIGAGVPRPKSATPFDTSNASEMFRWFHGCLYGEYGVRKSASAALFGTPEQTRILLTRSQSQLKPLENMGYKGLQCSDAAALTYGLMYAQKEWPEWASHPDPVLILDDATEAAAMLVDNNESKDMRKSYGGALNDLRDIIKLILPRPMHFIMTALAKVKENSITMEERVGPDLPPSMLNLVLTELDYTFYLDPRTWEFVTDREFFTYQDIDPATNKQRTYRREIFGKNKLSLLSVGSNILLTREPMNKGQIKMYPALRAVWEKIQKGRGVKK